MNPRTKWPTSAKVTFWSLVALLIVAALVRQPETRTVIVADLPPETIATTSTPSTTTSSTTTSTTTTTTEPAPTTPAPTEPPPPPPPEGPLAQLASLPVAERDVYLPYDRSAFGTAWTDNNGAEMGQNGCRTRDDILARDLTNLTFQGGSCTVDTGILNDPYTGQQIRFQYGQGTSNAVQIDHVIPLHAAWQLGAWQWDPQRRIDFANDPLELLAVDGPANQAKGSKLADEWMPPNAAFHCQYATITVQVHVRYSLPVTPAEKQTLTGVLERC